MKKSFFKVAALSVALFSASVMAKEYEIVNVVKVSGIPWFNQMDKGVQQAAKDLGVNAYRRPDCQESRCHHRGTE